MWIFQCWKFGVCRSKILKVTNCQSWRSQEKVCRPAPALVEPLSPSSSWTGAESFSKFDGWQLCSPLTYRPNISSIKPGTTLFKFELLGDLISLFKRCWVKSGWWNAGSRIKVPSALIDIELLCALCLHAAIQMVCILVCLSTTCPALQQPGVPIMSLQ